MHRWNVWRSVRRTLTIQRPCRACHLSCTSPEAPRCGGASACGRCWPLVSDLEEIRTQIQTFSSKILMLNSHFHFDFLQNATHRAMNHRNFLTIPSSEPFSFHFILLTEAVMAAWLSCQVSDSIKEKITATDFDEDYFWILWTALFKPPATLILAGMKQEFEVKFCFTSRFHTSSEFHSPFPPPESGTEQKHTGI